MMMSIWSIAVGAFIAGIFFGVLLMCLLMAGDKK